MVRLIIILSCLFYSYAYADIYDSSLVGLWTFDSNQSTLTTTNESSGHNNNGNYVNSPVSVPGMVGQGLSFSGTNCKIINGNCISSYSDSNYYNSNTNVTLANTSAYNYDRTSAFSTACWINLSPAAFLSPPSGSWFVDEGFIIANVSFFTGWVFETDANDSVSGGVVLRGLMTSNWGGPTLQVHETTTLKPNMWYHALMTYSGSSTPAGFKIYLNGVSQTLVTDSNNLGTNSIASGGGVGIGGSSTAWQQAPFNGYLDDCRIYNRVLSAAEASTLYYAGITKHGKTH